MDRFLKSVRSVRLRESVRIILRTKWEHGCCGEKWPAAASESLYRERGLLKGEVCDAD